MDDLVAQAAFEGSDEPAPALRRKCNAAGGCLEVGWAYFAIVDGLQHHRVGDQGPERLHQVERQGGASGSGVDDTGRGNASNPTAVNVTVQERVSSE